MKNQSVYLSGREVSNNSSPFIIAEIGQNHNGQMKMAMQLIDMAFKSGADAVKFTKRDIDSELTFDAYHKRYENPNSFGKSYGEHREFLEFDEIQHQELKNYAIEKGISYFCTPCDIPSLEIMERISVPFYKVASRDLTNLPLLEEMGRLNKPVIISTGMATYKDIEMALNALNLGRDKLIILHCTSQYPCELKNVNLNAIKTLKEKYNYLIGYSDHTSGIIVSVAAVLKGACVIEKHITLNRALKGTDQAGSLEEKGLKKLVNYISAVQESLGSSEKLFINDVANTKIKLSKSITSKIDIKKNTILTKEMICLKSPGDGIQWLDRHKIIGKKAIQDIAKNKTLFLNEFEQN